MEIDGLVEAEKNRLLAEFEGADVHRLAVLDGLFEQAACERVYLDLMNKQALVSGLVKCHPENPALQKVLPVSAEIARHSAALTNIIDKLMKHLAPSDEEDDDGFDMY